MPKWRVAHPFPNTLRRRTHTGCALKARINFEGGALFVFQKGASFFLLVLRSCRLASRLDSADTNSFPLSSRTCSCSTVSAWDVPSTLASRD
jgi:hypothetical protein